MLILDESRMCSVRRYIILYQNTLRLNNHIKSPSDRYIFFCQELLETEIYHIAVYVLEPIQEVTANLNAQKISSGNSVTISWQLTAGNDVTFAILKDGKEIPNLSINYSTNKKAGSVVIPAAVVNSGTYTLIVHASNIVSKLSSPPMTLTVVPVLVGLSLEVAQSVYEVDQPVNISAHLKAGGYFTYILDYGDGQTFLGQLASIVSDGTFLADGLTHTYNSAGSMTIRITLTDDIDKVEATANITIQGNVSLER